MKESLAELIKPRKLLVLGIEAFDKAVHSFKMIVDKLVYNNA